MNATFPIAVYDSNLREAPLMLVAPPHRVGVSDSHCPSSIDKLGELPNDLRRVVQAWPSQSEDWSGDTIAHRAPLTT